MPPGPRLVPPVPPFQKDNIGLGGGEQQCNQREQDNPPENRMDPERRCNRQLEKPCGGDNGEAQQENQENRRAVTDVMRAKRSAAFFAGLYNGDGPWSEQAAFPAERAAGLEGKGDILKEAQCAASTPPALPHQ